MLNIYSLSTGSPVSSNLIVLFQCAIKLRYAERIFEPVFIQFSNQKSCYSLDSKSSLGLESVGKTNMPRAIAMQHGECQERAACRVPWGRAIAGILYQREDNNSDWRSLKIFTYTLDLFLLFSWCLHPVSKDLCMPKFP